MGIFARNQREIRTTPCQLVVREAHVLGGAAAEQRPTESSVKDAPREDPPEAGVALTREKSGGEGRTIEGVAIVFGPEYRMTDYWGDTYVEKIAPEAVTEDWLKTQDVKLNLLHERDMTIARSKEGVGNLQMWTEKDGLHFSFEAPRCDLGDRALALVRAGVYSGCSFEFYPKDYEVKETTDANGEGVTEVTHTSFESLDALTIAMDPAYEETSVSARELREKIGKGLCTAMYAGLAAAEPRPTEPSTPAGAMARRAASAGTVARAAAEPRPTEPSTPAGAMARRAAERLEAARENRERKMAMSENLNYPNYWGS